jgi:tRNA-Thr(GGU) m(6)t(6)A37 methyltransferase TsaA
VESLVGKLVLSRPYSNPDAVRGIEEFSHLWIVFGFSAVERSEQTFQPTVRPPRLGGNQKVGVFASRSPFRPNGLGLSCVKLDRVDCGTSEGTVLWVSGVDMLNRTPVYDIKPYVPHADCKPNAVGGYADKNADYKLEVVCDPGLLEVLPADKREALLGCLAEDPRPAYIEHDDREYGMHFSCNGITYNVAFTVQYHTLTVTNIKQI